MNKQNKILDFEDFINTYSYKIPPFQLKEMINRNWLPLTKNSKLTKECAYLVGKVMGDGNLDPKYTVRLIGKLSDLKKVKDSISKEFNIPSFRLKIRAKKAKGTSHTLQINDALFGRLLFLLGAPIGNKTSNSFQVPNWIYSKDKFKRYFLMAILEDELSTIKLKKKNSAREPTFQMVKNKELIENLTVFLNQIKYLIESFGIKCSPISKVKYKVTEKENTTSYSKHFRILGNKLNIINFKNQIGFRFNLSKKEELIYCCDALIKNMRG